MHCYDPDGTLIGKVRLPEIVVQPRLRRPKRNGLFITASSSLYALMLTVNGAILNWTS